MFDDLGATIIAILFADFSEFGLDDATNFFLRIKNAFELFNKCLNFLEFIQDFLALQSSELLQTHLEDSCSLLVRKLELFHQTSMSILNIFGGTNQSNDFIDMIKSLFET